MHLSIQFLLATTLTSAIVRSQSNSNPTSIITSTLPDPSPNAPVQDAPFIGCYAADQTLKLQYGYIYQTSGWCQKVCLALSSPAAVMGLGAGAYCYCGDSLPMTKVDSSKCDTSCKGYGADKCGGDKYWSIYSTGLKQNLASSDGTSSSSSTSSTDTASNPGSPTAAVSTVTQGGTVFVTSVIPTTPASGSAASNGGGSSIAGIVAGVVVGIVLLSALIGAVIFFIRHKRKKAIEEEHRRAAAASELMASKRAQTASPFDARLEPVMLQKRQSDGSIADHQDYSRRILKVVNPDG